MKRWIGLLIVGQLLDGLTLAWFYLSVPAGWVGPTERNPVILLLMAAGGAQLVILVKLGLAGWVYSRRDRYSRMSTRVGRFMSHTLIPLAAISGCVGATFNAYAIWLLR